MRTFFRIVSYAARYRARLVLAFALALLGIAADLAKPWPVKAVVDYALAGRPLPRSLAGVAAALPGDGSREAILVWAVVAAALIVVVGAGLAYAVLVVTVHLGQRLVYDLWRDLFIKLQRLSLGYHSRHSVGDLMQRVAQDAFVAFSAVSQVLFTTTTSLLTLLGMFVIMARLDLTLSLVALAVVPALACAIAVFKRPIDRTTTLQWNRQGSLMALLEQSLAGIRVVQGFAREQYIESKLSAQADELADAYNRANRAAGAYAHTVSAITGIAAAVILGIGGTRVLHHHLTLGDLLVFVGYLAALYGPVSSVAIAVGTGITVVARGRRVVELLDADDVVPERASPRRIGRARGEVVFDAVSFGYAPERPIVLDVSFAAEPGQVVAVVGETGAGKTSLMALLSRFWDPWAGAVRLDGHDLRDLALGDVRENVALVLQEPFLFPISVADNIAFGRPGASRADIENAARAARAHEFIGRLPDGYDTVLTEKAASLSGGERQRIALARAIVKDAPVLVLDEPTSSLDARTESQIFDALTDLMRDRTTFVISHRLSTIRRADQILALDGGRIVERGTHEALLARDEVYARLYKHQHLAAV